jgi:hypothetical protein
VAEHRELDLTSTPAARARVKRRVQSEPEQARAHQQVLVARADLISIRAGKVTKVKMRLEAPVRWELKLREQAAVAAKDVIPANLSKDRAAKAALALLERAPLEQVPREPELVAEEEVSIPASIRARALKAPKPAQVDLKLAPTFRAELLKVVRRADKAPVAEKAVIRGRKLKDRRYREERKAAREE